MNDEKVKGAELGNSTLAILGGMTVTFLTGLVLYPLMQIVAENFWKFDLFGEKKGITVNDIIFIGILLIWIFVSALAGGFSCSLICRIAEYSHAFILTGVCLMLLLFTINKSERTSDLLAEFIGLVVVCTGFLTGTKIGVRKKKRRKDKAGQIDK